MYKTLMISRAGNVVFLISVIVAGYAGAPSIMQKMFAFSLLLCLLVDASISYKYPQLVSKIPSNTILANLFKSSFTYERIRTKNHLLFYMLICIVLLVFVSGKLFGYW